MVARNIEGGTFSMTHICTLVRLFHDCVFSEECSEGVLPGLWRTRPTKERASILRNSQRFIQRYFFRTRFAKTTPLPAPWLVADWSLDIAVATRLFNSDINIKSDFNLYESVWLLVILVLLFFIITVWRTASASEWANQSTGGRGLRKTGS